MHEVRLPHPLPANYPKSPHPNTQSRLTIVRLNAPPTQARMPYQPVRAPTPASRSCGWMCLFFATTAIPTHQNIHSGLAILLLYGPVLAHHSGFHRTDRGAFVLTIVRMDVTPSQPQMPRLRAHSTHFVFTIVRLNVPLFNCVRQSQPSNAQTRLTIVHLDATPPRPRMPYPPVRTPNPDSRSCG